ncbi:hypothetical protein H6G50_10045 [Oscillatoria sp. FACHB-1406]|nr:hypothetical protein [Oscillatoria sp. FACHB-1406]
MKVDGSRLYSPSCKEILSFFQQRLENANFEFGAIGHYQNEGVYRARKGNFQIYLLFVPTTRRIADGSPRSLILASPELPLDAPTNP